MNRPVPDDVTPVGRSRAATWVGRVVVGLAALVTVTLVVAVVGYVVLVDRWADAYDTSGGPDARPTSSSVTGSTGTSAEQENQGLDSSNEAYRERRGTPESDAEAALSVPVVEAALTPLLTGEALQRDEVVAALTGAGFETFGVTPETTVHGDPATSFGVGVSVPGGCVYGGVTPQGVTLDAGGPIADGGCLEMPTH
ncbi:DUF6993 domain-containing protein [Oerskovia sp. NPDC057915]|uniref:DUF6993 domain-containing protein n=1 Tax=Oerskovia sp. NPDC057915 TaxID=3346280 RepID=UPI0036DB3682